MTDHRRQMDPSTLECLIMLRMNKELWDERDMEWILCNPRAFDDIDNDNYDNDGEQQIAVGARRPRDERDISTDEAHSQLSNSTADDRRHQRITTSSHGWHPFRFTSSTSTSSSAAPRRR